MKSEILEDSEELIKSGKDTQYLPGDPIEASICRRVVFTKSHSCVISLVKPHTGEVVFKEKFNGGASQALVRLREVAKTMGFENKVFAFTRGDL
jgi:hypothetical protein